MDTLLAHYDAVADFDSWSQEFAARESLRKQCGVTEARVHRVHGHPEQVVLLLASPNAGRSQACLQGQPAIELLSVRSFDLPATDSRAALVFRHAVADFDKWQQVYSSHDELRREKASADGDLVTTRQADPNFVVGYVRAANMKRLESFFGTDSTKGARRTAVDTLRAMADGGVTAAPDLTLLDLIEVATYA